MQEMQQSVCDSGSVQMNLCNQRLCAETTRYARNALLNLCVFAISACATLESIAQTVLPKSGFGEWEVVNVLLARDLADPPAPPEGGYGIMLGRRFDISRDTVAHGLDLQTGVFDTSFAKRQLPFESLFEEKKTAQRAPGILGQPGTTWLKSPKHYALRDVIGAYEGRKISVYTYRFDKPAMVNDRIVLWFVLIGDTLLAHDSGNRNMILVLRRAHTGIPANQIKACKALPLGIQQNVCAEPEIWRLYRYAETTLPCALNHPFRDASKLPDELRAIEGDLKACESAGDGCIQQTILKKAKLVGSYIPPTKLCVEGAYKDLP